MRLENTTRFPDKVVRAVFRAVAPRPGLGIHRPRLKPPRGVRCARVFYPGFCMGFQPGNVGVVLRDLNWARHKFLGRWEWDLNRIVLQLPASERTAERLGLRESRIRRSRMEMLVSVMAHELKHVDQWDSKDPWKSSRHYGMMPHVFEAEAVAYEKKMLRLFRLGKILPQLREVPKRKR